MEDWIDLPNLVPADVVQHIQSIPRGNRERNDYAIWNLTKDDIYSNNSAWHLVRATKPKDDFNNKLPFDDTINKFGNHIVSKCLCCRDHNCETLKHVFFDSEVAIRLWKFFGNPLGIQWYTDTIRGILTQWWQRKPKNMIHKMVLQIIPICIIWEIWRSYTACKYGENTRYYLYKMINQILWNVKAAVSRTYPNITIHLPWSKACEMIEKLKPSVTWMKVQWEMPEVGNLKVHTDGSFFKDTKTGGIGGKVRNEHGDFIMAFSVPLQCNNSNMAELKAVKFAAKWCMNQRIPNFTLEMDSLVICTMIRQRATQNNKLRRELEDIISYTDHDHITISHCLRETNQVADWLAKDASNLTEGIIYSSFHQ
ncbi:uncharacterized protein [Nicotiana sylvestris]|uniref:uncharacterized protein n=1 Tax=Nicotiana sylvestris TaxID=4096 RepID=UPI00388CD563